MHNVESALGVKFEKKELLCQAFVHRSYANESPKRAENNERLEFLGDSVLGLVAADFLFLKFPEADEGDLSRFKSILVDAVSCAHYMKILGLEDFLLLGKGERGEKRGREKILANAFEAVIGAIYLDQGMETARDFLLGKLKNEWDKRLSGPVANFKAELQDLIQKEHKLLPVYRVLETSGPEHLKHFKVAVFVGEVEMGIGEGSFKKEAEQNAALNALHKLKK